MKDLRPTDAHCRNAVFQIGNDRGERADRCRVEQPAPSDDDRKHQCATRVLSEGAPGVTVGSSIKGEMQERSEGDRQEA